MNILYEIKECQTEKKGKGLFTRQFIKKGDIIWSSKNDNDVIEINDDKLLEYLNCYSQNEVIDILDHMYCYNGKCYNIINCDCKYTNHSLNPTSYVDSNNSSIAIRDIDIGEEITEDYRTYDNYLPEYYKLMQKYKGGTWSELVEKWY